MNSYTVDPNELLYKKALGLYSFTPTYHTQAPRVPPPSFNAYVHRGYGTPPPTFVRREFGSASLPMPPPNFPPNFLTFMHRELSNASLPTPPPTFMQRGFGNASLPMAPSAFIQSGFGNASLPMAPSAFMQSGFGHASLPLHNFNTQGLGNGIPFYPEPLRQKKGIKRKGQKISSPRPKKRRRT